MRKVIVAVFVSGLLGLMLASPVFAQTAPYPPSCGGIAVSSSTVPPGGTITASATCLPPNTLTTFTFQSTPVVVGTGTSDASGTTTLTFTIPAGATPGVHTISAAAGGVTKSVTITVAVPGVAAPPTNLKRTGTDIRRPIGVALVLVLVGGATIVLARRRNRV